MAYHNLWMLISENGFKYQLQINDEKKIFMISKSYDGMEIRIELTDDSYESSVIKGLTKIDEVSDKANFEEAFRIAMKNLNEFLLQN